MNDENAKNAALLKLLEWNRQRVSSYIKKVKSKLMSIENNPSMRREVMELDLEIKQEQAKLNKMMKGIGDSSIIDHDKYEEYKRRKAEAAPAAPIDPAPILFPLSMIDGEWTPRTDK